MSGRSPARAMPRSSTATRYTALPNAGLRYVHLPRLGGLRQSRDSESPKGGWRSAGFRGFADHMQTEEFARGLDELWGLAGQCRTAIMYAEALYWRCHRARNARSFMGRGRTSSAILAKQKAEDHRMPPYAV